MIAPSLILYTISLYWLTFAQPLAGTIMATGNGGTSGTFDSSVLAKLFDRATGTFYVGLQGPASNNFAVAKAPRLLNSAYTPTFSGIASNALFGTNGVQALARAARLGDTNPLLAGLLTSTPVTTVFAMTNSGSQALASSTLLDASGSVGSSGAETNGIVGLSANEAYIFTAVAPSNDSFGASGSGIAVVKLFFNTPRTMQQPLDSLKQTGAVAGDSGIKAYPLDQSTPELRITNDFIVSTTTAVLTWDEQLDRLYIGMALVQTNVNANDGVRSVAVAKITDPGIVTLKEIAPASIFPAGDLTRIVGVVNDSTDQHSLAVNHLAIMHASTGPSYLIIDGGNVTMGPNPLNKLIFALPLVDDPTSPFHGMLAKKDSIIGASHTFTVPATSPADGVTSADPAAIVGAVPFPIDTVSDMVVVGDTVYIALNTPQTADNEAGLFFSQAIFDEQGRIARWTPWKRAYPFDSALDAEMITTTSLVNDVFLCDVDAVTAQIWAVGGTGGADNHIVTLTRWDRAQGSPQSLVNRLNVACSEGCPSMLELDWYTRGFDGATGNTYALFGSVNRVVFARTSESLNGTSAFGPHALVNNFADARNFLVTTLPDSPGCITALEYSRTTTTQGNDAGCTSNRNNFFFAGTGAGLYAFAQPNGTGFSPADLAYLNQFPFSQGQWSLAPNIFGSVIGLACRGNALYVLTFQTTPQQPFKNIVYRVGFTGAGTSCSLSTLFGTANIFVIAETGVDVFSDVLQFTGLELVASGTTETNMATQEQLALTTNQGLFISGSVQTGGIAGATTQTQAAWNRVSETTCTLFTAITGMDTPVPQTVWPAHLSDEKGFQTLARSSIDQYSGRGNSDLPPTLLFAKNPTNFNGCIDEQCIPTLPPTLFFMSDGARRTFLVKNSDGVLPSTRLMIWPFYDAEWALTQPESTVSYDPGLASTNNFVWVSFFGSLGLVLAGTNQGVVALE